jgi:tetratricopeptide (TPR) repeat protein
MTVLRLLLVMVAIAWPAASLLAGDEQDCFQGQEPALRIKGCSQVIQRAPNDPAGYHNRAVAYGLAGDLDNAIADYTKVIEMAPDNASAYDNRGRTYASKGDQTHAAEDRAKARELMAKAIAQPIMPRPKAPRHRLQQTSPRAHRRKLHPSQR